MVEGRPLGDYHFEQATAVLSYPTLPHFKYVGIPWCASIICFRCRVPVVVICFQSPPPRGRVGCVHAPNIHCFVPSPGYDASFAGRRAPHYVIVLIDQMTACKHRHSILVRVRSWITKHCPQVLRRSFAFVQQCLEKVGQDFSTFPLASMDALNTPLFMPLNTPTNPTTAVPVNTVLLFRW